MRRIGFLKGAALAVACWGLVVPQAALMAAEPQRLEKPAKTPQRPAVHDVALGEGGTLAGKVVDGQGLPLDGAAVSMRQGNKVIASTVTDAEGSFNFSNLRGGSYELVAGQARSAYRLWAANTAPPSAQDQVLMVSDNQVVRGQIIDGGLVGAPVATAVALGLGVAGVTLAAVNYGKLNSLQNQVDKIPTSP